jgi:hypothetical protein
VNDECATSRTRSVCASEPQKGLDCNEFALGRELATWELPRMFLEGGERGLRVGRQVTPAGLEKHRFAFQVVGIGGCACRAASAVRDGWTRR